MYNIDTQILTKSAHKTRQEKRQEASSFPVVDQEASSFPVVDQEAGLTTVQKVKTNRMTVTLNYNRSTVL